MLFPRDKKLVFTSRNEGLAENYVPVEEKNCFHWQQLTAI